MKLAMVITSLEVGGAEKLVLDLIRELADKIEIRLFIIRKNYKTIYDKKLPELNIKYQYLNGKSSFFSFKAAKALKKILDEYRPDIIHSHLKAADYIWFYRRRRKNFRWIHTVHTKADVDLKRIRRIFFRPLLRNGSILPVVVSSEVGNSLKQIFGVKGYLIENGVDLERFKYLPEEKELFKIIHVGSFTPVKNHQFLIKEFARFAKERKNTRLILIGDGPLKKRITRMARKLEIAKQISFIKNTDKVEKYLQEACVFVLPSHYEGMSLALLEALASGLLVVVSRGLTKLIENEVNGFEIDLEENALYYEFQNLYENYLNLETVRRNAARFAMRYSLKQMADNYLNLYKRVLYD
jgi:glycosyltransferase involved in cell wall biosynthesis